MLNQLSYQANLHYSRMILVQDLVSRRQILVLSLAGLHSQHILTKEEGHFHVSSHVDHVRIEALL